MAFSKAPVFDDLPFLQSYFSKALSHPARVIILEHLLECEFAPFQDLRKKIPLAQTTVSQHLRSLREKGLIEGFQNFPHTYYRLNKSFCKNLTLKLSMLLDDLR